MGRARAPSAHGAWRGRWTRRRKRLRRRRPPPTRGRSPRPAHAVELQALGAELGDAFAQVAAGAMALLAVAVPGAEAHDLGGLVVVGDAPLLQDLVAGRGDEAVALSLIHISEPTR